MYLITGNFHITCKKDLRVQILGSSELSIINLVTKLLKFDRANMVGEHKK